MPEDFADDLSALADAADKAGRGQEAIHLAREALRRDYLAEAADTVAASHDSLGNYLARNAADYPGALPHHLASALLLTLADSVDVPDSVSRTDSVTRIDRADVRHSLISVARDLAQLPGGAIVPASVSELSAAVGEVPGVHLDRLLAQLNGDPAAVQGALDALLGQARTWADPDTPLPRHLASWDPVIAGMIAARGGNEQARAAVEQHLAERMGSADWSRLAGTLSAILNGQNGADQDGADQDGAGQNGAGLLDGLDKIDTAIATRALAALSGDDQVPSQLWPAIPFSPLIGRMVSAAWGDQATAAQLAPQLVRMGTDSELAPLAGALRRILQGERAPGLAHDLDPVSAAVVITILFHVPPASQP